MERFVHVQVDRIARVGFETARKRSGKLCSVDKANVLEVRNAHRLRYLSQAFSEKTLAFSAAESVKIIDFVLLTGMWIVVRLARLLRFIIPLLFIALAPLGTVRRVLLQVTCQSTKQGEGAVKNVRPLDQVGFHDWPLT